MIQESNIFYTILRAEKGKEIYNKTEYLFGKKLLEKKDSVLKQFLCKEKERLQKIEKQLKNTEKAQQRLHEIVEQKKWIEEAEQWYY